MFAAHDDGEITFYEELGVAPDASPQEIRDAFHAYARLLHPDQQSDPVLRAFAEKQMRKLNRVYAVLSDPGRRREYDEIMGEPPGALIVNDVPAPSGFGRWRARMPWVAAIVVSAGVLIWLAYDAAPGSPNRSVDSNSVSAAAPRISSAPAANAKSRPLSNESSDAAAIARLKSELTAAVTQRDAALQEVEKLRGASENRTQTASNSSEPRPAEPAGAAPLTITELPSAPKTAAAVIANVARSETPLNRKLAGFWFYARPPEGQQNKDRSLYLPEYIEATITEENGTIHGRYRSRFLIADRAIPPDVNFTFSGTPNGTQCNCTWTGAGGAKGDLTLKLTGENSLKVDWIASQLGSLGLGSGTAILTRKID